MPGQIVLDPADSNTTSSWQPPFGVAPRKLRDFGRFPDVSSWSAGDLLLFSAVRPSRFDRAIIASQLRGGYAEEDARWHHAAVYLGDEISICEATWTGVRYATIYPYIGNYLLRVRRASNLTPQQRWLIALQSLTRLGFPYGFWTIARLALLSLGGFWRTSGDLPRFEDRSAICSQLFSDSYFKVTRRLLTDSGTPPPAALSFTPDLTDVSTSWLNI